MTEFLILLFCCVFNVGVEHAAQKTDVTMVNELRATGMADDQIVDGMIHYGYEDDGNGLDAID